MIAFDKHLAACRGFFGWFENDGIARNQGRDNVTVGQMRREVIWAEHGHDAVRLVAQRLTIAHVTIEAALRRALVV